MRWDQIPLIGTGSCIIGCTIIVVKIDFYSAKNDRNVAERGLSFDLVSSFDFETAANPREVRDYERTRTINR